MSGEGASWLVLVPADDAAHAEAALAAYDRETADAVVAGGAPPAGTPYPWMSGVTVALALLGAFGVTGPPAGSRWFERGAAIAGRIVADEPWRAVTALTLHVDAVHVLGNAVASAVLVPPLVQRLGVGVAVWLMLVAGVLGNALSAVVHAPDHVAIGASTATFGVIGALAAIRLAPPKRDVPTRRGWVVIAASILLLVFLGTARTADVIAHAAGLVAGLGLGFGAGFFVRRALPATVQGALIALTAFTVAAAWWLALRG
ncbi:MAG: rhomboid family intramembrane serine protease [Candidatus Rokubacteria bacterium]|nr:rhomboid family intramembrane serine protease [Candidatus Rokubacteria bacterium]